MNRCQIKRMTENKNRMYGVPDGYFEGLQARLSAIPAMEAEAESRVTVWAKVRPVIALAASFAILLTVGTLILSKTAGRITTSDSEFLEYAYAMIPLTEPYSIYDASLAESLYQEVSVDDIENYLIETGVSINQLGYVEAFE